MEWANDVDNDDYRWFEFVDHPLSERFPSGWPWLAGAEEWVDGTRTLPEMDETGGRRWLNRIRRTPRKTQASTCPRIFVSHRQVDEQAALQLAWLAHDEGWGYWLDLIDLDSATRQINALERWLGRPPMPLEISILTAAIIEMGLLNCTHVIAAMTGNTKGSQWVPYEYGRVKEATPVAMNAASWWDTTTLKELPEYLHLAPILKNQKQIRSWLRGEMRNEKKKRYPNCPGRGRNDWPKHVPRPGPLPTG